ncbi:MAG: dockerin type I domain-containing protein, partial [Phycisphaerales bacterium]
MFGCMRLYSLTLILTLPLIGPVKAACPQGDLNRDCRVDLLDLQVLAEQWLIYPESAADLNGDDEVNVNDLA